MATIYSYSLLGIFHFVIFDCGIHVCASVFWILAYISFLSTKRKTMHLQLRLVIIYSFLFLEFSDNTSCVTQQ